MHVVVSECSVAFLATLHRKPRQALFALSPLAMPSGELCRTTEPSVVTQPAGSYCFVSPIGQVESTTLSFPTRRYSANVDMITACAYLYHQATSKSHTYVGFMVVLPCPSPTVVYPHCSSLRLPKLRYLCTLACRPMQKVGGFIIYYISCFVALGNVDIGGFVSAILRIRTRKRHLRWCLCCHSCLVHSCGNSPSSRLRTCDNSLLFQLRAFATWNANCKGSSQPNYSVQDYKKANVQAPRTHKTRCKSLRSTPEDYVCT